MCERGEIDGMDGIPGLSCRGMEGYYSHGLIWSGLVWSSLVSSGLVWYDMAHLEGTFPLPRNQERRREGGKEGGKEGNEKGDVGFNLSMVHTMVDHRHTTAPTVNPNSNSIRSTTTTTTKHAPHLT